MSVVELSAFVERSKWLFDRSMSLREQRNRANEQGLGNESQAAGERDVALSKKFTAERHIRQELLDVGFHPRSLYVYSLYSFPSNSN